MVKEVAQRAWEIIGNKDGSSNLTREEFDALGKIFRERSEKYSEEQKRTFELMGVYASMISYIDTPEDNGTILEIGHFIKKILAIYHLPHKKLADYLGINKSNFSALMSGKRKINFDLALKLAHIFGIKADLWLMVQNKNELWKLENANKEEYEKYSLKGLMAA